MNLFAVLIFLAIVSGICTIVSATVWDEERIFGSKQSANQARTVMICFALVFIVAGVLAAGLVTK